MKGEKNAFLRSPCAFRRNSSTSRAAIGLPFAMFAYCAPLRRSLSMAPPPSHKYSPVAIVSISLSLLVTRLRVRVCASAVINMSTTVPSIQQAEVEETMKRIQTHKGVHGFVIMSNDGRRVVAATPVRWSSADGSL